MNYLHKKLSLVCGVGAGLSMFCIFTIIFVNSLLRYTTGKSLEMGEELPVYLSVYGVMFGIVLAYLQGRHINFTIFIEKAPLKVQKFSTVLTDISMIIIGLALTYSGWLFVVKRGHVEASGLIGSAKELVQATGIQSLQHIGLMGSWYFAFCLGGVLLSVAACARLSQNLSKLKEEG